MAPGFLTQETRGRGCCSQGGALRGQASTCSSCISRGQRPGWPGSRRRNPSGAPDVGTARCQPTPVTQIQCLPVANYSAVSTLPVTTSAWTDGTVGTTEDTGCSCLLHTYSCGCCMLCLLHFSWEYVLPTFNFPLFLPVSVLNCQYISWRIQSIPEKFFHRHMIH